MPYPPVQHPPCSTPYLDATLVCAAAIVVMFIAALAGLVAWMIAAGLVALAAAVVASWVRWR